MEVLSHIEITFGYHTTQPDVGRFVVPALKCSSAIAEMGVRSCSDKSGCESGPDTSTAASRLGDSLIDTMGRDSC
jgi:hypothetical protein